MLLRVSLAAMLALAALGGLPRHGTAPWAEPTLFVPDMQLSLAPGWGWLAIAQLILAAFLAAGLLTRAAGLALVALSLLGLAAFGPTFTAYAPHFIAPGLMLAVCGGGALALDRHVGTEDWLRPPERLARAGWIVALALIGGGFVYLGVTFKLTQPTLIIAILEHGHVPVLGLPLPVVALVMAGVEVIAGTLFALRRLTRPIAIFLIGAFTFFALTLGESPLLHANLYGAMGFCLLSGRTFRPPGRSGRRHAGGAAMTRWRAALARHGSFAVLAGLLAALSVAAPVLNAAAGPPRTLFLRLPATLPEPELALAASEAPDGSWQLRIEASGFRFTALCVADAAAVPVGHAHVILDDRKIASAFVPVVDLGVLPPGDHQVQVVLRAQDHRALVGSHGLVQARIVISVPLARLASAGPERRSATR